MSICSVCFVLVVALVKVLEAVPLFDCTKLDTQTDCDAVSFCFWNTTCPNSHGSTLGDGNPNDNVACLPKCVPDPCLMKLTTVSDICEPTGSPGYSCAKVSYKLPEHTCTSSSNETIYSHFCKLSGTPTGSDCFWNYYKTERCNTVVNGDYCKLYDIGGGKTCEGIRDYETVESASCSDLSAEHCNYRPNCHISETGCSSWSYSGSYDPLTQSCTSGKDYVPYKFLFAGSPPYSYTTLPLFLYTYTNKSDTPGDNVVADWTYTSKTVNIVREYYCYHKSLSPNTCYYLSTAIQQYPSYDAITYGNQREKYWNYATCNQPRDACGWCPNLDFAFDDSPCTSQGCSVVTYNGERICVAPSSGTCLHRSPSFILTLLFVCVVFLFSN